MSFIPDRDDHDEALGALQRLPGSRRAALSAECDTLNAVASAYAAGEPAAVDRRRFADALKTVRASGSPFGYAPTDDADRRRAYLGPSTPWTLIEIESQKVIARFSAPDSGNELLSAEHPALTELIGRLFHRRKDARDAVEQRLLEKAGA